MQVNQPKEGGTKATTPPSDTAAPITCEQIQQYMTGGGCPTAGALGECAAMWCEGNVWTAALYIWNPDFHDSAAVAGWFRSLGASEIEITHTLYSTANGDRNGQCFEGVTCQWLIEFTMRKAPNPQTELNEGRAAPVAQTKLVEALREAERFIAGFEGCESQEGIGELLMRIRAAQSELGGSHA